MAKEIQKTLNNRKEEILFKELEQQGVQKWRERWINHMALPDGTDPHTTDLKLREKYGINIVVLVREGENIVAPQATEILYPGDSVLCFATDSEIEKFKDDVEAQAEPSNLNQDVDAYDIKRLRVDENSQIKGVSIQKSGIREKFGCTVVGLERGTNRFRSPSSEMPLESNDVLWIVGERGKLLHLEGLFTTQ